MVRTIDVNCDLAEGLGNEELLMPLISSCNIACGGHAGSLEVMSYVVDLAHKYQVKIGAHPSFPDRKNFGRKVMSLSRDHLFDSIRNQIEGLNSILAERNLPLNHVKPHGALYNCAAVDESVAEVIVEVVKSLDKDVLLYVPYGSVIEKIANNHGVSYKIEVFADRNYNTDLTLVSRNQENAIIHDSNEMFQHVFEMIMHGKVTTVNGVGKRIKADTICMHGDGENVVHNLRVLVDKFRCHNIEII